MNGKTVFKIVLKTLLPLLVVGVAGMLFVKLVQSRQPPTKQERPHLGPLVQVMPVQREDVAVTVKAFGTVRPRKELDVIPQVSGQVVEVSPNLISGGFMAEGELLLRIDPRDYELAVEKARAEVARAAYELTRASEEAEVARQEWDLLRTNPPLLLKENPPAEDGLLFHGPQLDLARANVAAAQARLSETELFLSRTEIRAPYAARVRAESVGLGQYVTPGRSLAALYSIDVAEVVFPVPDEDLQWIGGGGLLNNSVVGPRVTIRAADNGKRRQWAGRVVRTDGVIDPQSRMVHLIAEVQDPYRRGGSPLTVGMFVEGTIHGRRLNGVLPIPRHALRENDTVWVTGEDNRLWIREVEVARLTDTRAYVAAGLDPGELVVLSRLDAVTEGMSIRVAEGE